LPDAVNVAMLLLSLDAQKLQGSASGHHVLFST